MAVYTTEALNTMEFEINDDKVKCLWVGISRKANKTNILVAVCYRSPNQDEEVD